MRPNQHDPLRLPLPENGVVADLISDDANADKERADRFIERARERAAAKQARLDAMAAPRPVDRDKDDA
jgi:hypothetical protein